MKKILDSSSEIDRALLSFRAVFFQVGAFSFAINLLMLAPAIYMMQIYDRVLSSRNEITLAMLTVLLIGLYGLMGMLEWVRAKILVRVGTKLDFMLHERAFYAAFTQNLKREGGTPAQAIHDLTNIRQFATSSAIFAFFDAPWVPLFIIVIAMIHPVLGYFSLFAAVTLFVMALLNEVYTRPPLDEASTQSMAASGYANNNLRNAEVIEAMGMLHRIYARWLERQKKFLALQSLASDRSSVINSATKIARLGFQSFIIGLAAWLAIDGEIPPGGLIGAMVLMGRTLGPVEQLIGAWKHWISARTSYHRLGELLSNHPELPRALTLPAPTGEVNVENITVVPPGSENPVLNKLSFKINPGDIVGVIGPSASGKSSLARTLLGIWRPSEGSVRLGAANVADWNKDELGHYLGYLPQDIELFEGTIAENISRFNEIDSEKVIEAATKAGVHEMILRLPQGYETLAGADGASLSGGQRQRIGLARALYGNPVFIVLDEPNSNLDEAGEIALVRTLKDLKEQLRTVVVITHKLNVLSAVDKLLVLGEGALVAYGQRDKVIEFLKDQQNDRVSHLQKKSV
jgi:ATP-binding cassette subfamily C exporter for protease/lipase